MKSLSGKKSLSALADRGQPDCKEFSRPDRHPVNNPISNGVSAVAPSVVDWIGEIKKIWARGGANTLELAQAMCAARSQLTRGKWTAIWKSGCLPFSKRKGDMLAAIGSGLRWANEQTFAHLPLGWSVLYHLAKLNRRILESLIEEGMIHAGLKLSEAKNLVARFKGGPHGLRSKRFNVRRRLQQFGEFVDLTLSTWSPQERCWAQTRLQEILHQIAEVSQNRFEPLPAGRSIASQWITGRFPAMETNSLNAQRPTPRSS